MIYHKSIPVLVVSLFFVICFIVFDYSQSCLSEQVSADVGEYPTVIIDAGHGGFDGGASAADGTNEKDINLSISLELKTVLTERGVKVVMIREDDRSVEDDGLSTVRSRKVSDLHNRLKVMANTDNCIYVSIHQNFFDDTRCKGMQVFYSPNYSESSSLLAQYIQNSVTETLQPDNTRLIKPCGTSVYIIYNAVKPAVLVECGFLSNPEEADKLKNKEYQRSLSESIADGILNYFCSLKNEKV